MNGSSSTMRMRVSMGVTTLRSTAKRKRERDRRPAPGVVGRELATREPCDVLGRRPFDLAEGRMPDAGRNAGDANHDDVGAGARLRADPDLELALAVHRRLDPARERR